MLLELLLSLISLLRLVMRSSLVKDFYAIQLSDRSTIYSRLLLRKSCVKTATFADRL